MRSRFDLLLLLVFFLSACGARTQKTDDADQSASSTQYTGDACHDYLMARWSNTTARIVEGAPFPIPEEHRAILGQKSALNDSSPPPSDVEKVNRAIVRFLAHAPDDPSLLWRQQEIARIVGSFENYYVQYLRSSAQSDEEIVANFFFVVPEGVCPTDDHFADWRRKLVSVMGGGSDFWFIRYDARTDSVIDFWINANK